MDKKEQFASRKEYLEWAAKKFPCGSQSEAVWARSLEAGWRVYCGHVGRDPAYTGDSRRTDPMTAEEAEEAARYRAEAERHAQNAKNCRTSFPASELAASWLALRGRAPDGRRFAD